MTEMKNLIFLDRDGVLNELVVDAEQGTVDSPLAESQVRIYPDVPEALAELTRAGYGLVIVSNQPAAAKGKTTQANLERVNTRIVNEVQAKGGKVLSSHLCFHRAEDRCACRKPRPGLLEEAIRRHGIADLEGSWLVGDGITDLQAAQTLGIKTAFVASQKSDVMRLLETKHIQPPTLWVDNLKDFVAKEKTL